MSTDPFSDILRLTKAGTVLAGRFTAGGKWGVHFAAPASIKFFAVLKGSCWVSIQGSSEPMHFEAGDIGLMAALRSFTLTSGPKVVPVDSSELFAGGSTAVIGDGSEFTYVSGHVLLDPDSGKLLMDVLPKWLHIRSSFPEAAKFRWLLDQLFEERGSDQIGAGLASEQMAQLLFIQVLRARLKSSDELPVGWLRAFGDSRLAPALRLMHADPARPWHLDELARACAMSRTSFALHFRNVVGVAPRTYLSQWRMHLARRALIEESTSVAVVGQTIGYTSESAFSNAFKRLTGKSPQAYRLAVALGPVPHAATVAAPKDG